MQHPSIIIVDENSKNREAIQAFLLNEGFDVQSFNKADEAIEKIKSNQHSIVITNLKLADRDGIQFLDEIKSYSKSIPVLIFSSDCTINLAVEAMKHGASDFLLKPFSNQSIILSVKKAVKDNYSKLRDLNTGYPGNRNAGLKKIVTKSSAMLRILECAKSIAKSNASVLIQGESGTGKELLAGFIVNNSGRETRPYVKMNCAALPDNLAESELFGHEKGAFTGAFQKRIGKFEQADKGTLLLDEISELSMPLQAKLLRVIQEKVVDRLGGVRPININTRIIATCNVNLQEAVNQKQFRKDLFYRVNVIPFTIPPLRERKEDIPLLSEFFINKHCNINNKKKMLLSSGAHDYLYSHDWPGNVRELENAIERAVLICETEEIYTDHFFLDSNKDNSQNENDLIIGTTVKDMEKKLIFNTLKHVNDNRTHAAKLLGISIRTLRNKLREYRGEDLYQHW